MSPLSHHLRRLQPSEITLRIFEVHELRSIKGPVQETHREKVVRLRPTKASASRAVEELRQARFSEGWIASGETDQLFRSDEWGESSFLGRTLLEYRIEPMEIYRTTVN
jgi:hypothetical protein